MKILWVGDAVVSSGFARCTHAVCDHLHARGHDVHVLGIGYHGDPHDYPYKIYPPHHPFDGAFDPFGVDRLPVLINRLAPDVVVILNDPWNVPAYMERVESLRRCGGPAPLVVGWLAVDGKNQKGYECTSLDHVVTWTLFGIQELQRGGLPDTHPFSIVPLGVDPAVFYPMDRAACRAEIFADAPPDVQTSFIVGVVGRNQPRKRLDLTLQYFAEWLDGHDINRTGDAYLFLHVGPTGDAGFDLDSLIRYYDLAGRVMIFRPVLGLGAVPSLMPKIYNSLDVLLSTTQGEGWGLPVHEAMACGVVPIVPRWSALAEWPHGARRVACHETATTAPTNHQMFTIGGVPDRAGTIIALADAYDHWKQGIASPDAATCLETARALTWASTAEKFERVLEQVVARGRVEPEPEPEPQLPVASEEPAA